MAILIEGTASVYPHKKGAVTRGIACPPEVKGAVARGGSPPSGHEQAGCRVWGSRTSCLQGGLGPSHWCVMGSALIIVIGAPGKAEGELVVGTLNSGPHLGVQTWGVSGVVMLKTAIPRLAHGLRVPFPCRVSGSLSQQTPPIASSP